MTSRRFSTTPLPSSRDARCQYSFPEVSPPSLRIFSKQPGPRGRLVTTACRLRPMGLSLPRAKSFVTKQQRLDYVTYICSLTELETTQTAIDRWATFLM